MNRLEQRIAEMEALGAKRTILSAAEAQAIDAEPGSEWIGTDGHAWLLPTIADQDTRHWKQTLRDLKHSVAQMKMEATT